MKKVLIVASVIRFMNFERNDVNILKSLGYEVHCAANMENEHEKTKAISMIRHHIDFSRNPFCRDTFRAYKQIKELLEQEDFELIHCHTPAASIITRFACRKMRRKGVKVLYTAHGFHFFKGAPLKNWLLYYPAEWICSWWTDVQITINKEDYSLASKRFHAHKVYYIPGVGVESIFYEKPLIDRIEKRKQIHIDKNAFVMLSVGELADRKNQMVVLEAMANIKSREIFYLIVGEGEKKEKYIEFCKENGLEDNVIFMGGRNDVHELCTAVDIFIHPSIREGLGIAPLEAMASGLPIIGSYINGMKDYLIDKETGICIEHPENVVEIRDAIVCMKNMSKEEIRKIGDFNKKRAQKFSETESSQKMREIYTKIY